MKIDRKRVSLVGLGVSAVVLALSTGCTQPVEAEEVAKTEQAPLQLWAPISLVEQTDIAAPADSIWRDLVTVSCYSHWNPWLTEAADPTHPDPGAAIEVGDQVTATVIITGGPQHVSHRVLEVTPPGAPDQPAGQIAQLCWRDDNGITSDIAPAHRCRTLTANSDGTVHEKNELVLEGVVDWLAFILESSALKKGMAAENAALKALAEKGEMDPVSCEVQ
jgi:hypothetical protein